MNRNRILEIINEVILEEMDTVAVTEESRLVDSNLDSFGYAMFWIGVATKLKEEGIPHLSKECVDGYDLSSVDSVTVAKIIDDIEAL